MDNAIETENLSLSIGSFQLNKLQTSIPSGKMTGIVGPNGSGKSTLLKIIAKLLIQDQGHVTIDSQPSTNLNTKEFARLLAMMPQIKQSVPNLTVKELIAFGRSPYKKWFQTTLNEEDNEVIDWAMSVTGTRSHAKRLFHTLSGGEQQKVRIALALAQKTHILLLDEPTTYLDIAHQLDVMEMLEEINRTYQITVVMVLHELQQAAAYCDHLIAMKNGTISDEGPPKTLLNSHFLKKVYNIDARVSFKEEFPTIIPIKRRAIK
ncbi:ABC transporter ATP-binding protein [Salipaludibacillus agaradhaerens]|uniref:ABC transporter ATP-binding protein n=1 Tax=Salipaludibacillus agaradhaerens TaxID=76935 RepID=UPI002151AEAA|nr:ABC transporter ATP-binding protein [Salipaludibacillus agaradhaerens]MCR6107419.1 ABC transporter ATP-binding protein [Salipaludibacillus agaradhaerens]MCR6111472.1 ABC transporter ATP-binding protein [Bacillus sp. A301a_S52]MCR6119448.1 ABC transporter ATP-binding protein [Salipaludibacillus agaradhaerens]UJW58475.1 ABC transporter ATP-binding protein [Bacillus sp. A116_S68]